MNPIRTTPISYLITLFIVSICWSLIFIKQTNCELFSSVDELSRWPELVRQLSTTVDELIQLEEDRLSRLKRIKELTSHVIQIGKDSGFHYVDRNNNGTEVSDAMQAMLHPVNAFVTLNKLATDLEDVRELLDEQFEYLGDLAANNERFNQLGQVFNKSKELLPSYDDVVGSGLALLRLQEFYTIKIDNLVDGSLSSGGKLSYFHNMDAYKAKNHNSSYEMSPEDCFELGRIAFHEKLTKLAAQWFKKALDMASERNLDDNNDDTDSKVANDVFINEVLEYLAFSAYKLDQIEYAANVTQIWLQRDPHNDRAIDNMQFYLEELGVMNNASHYAEQARGLDSIGDLVIPVVRKPINKNRTMSFEDYVLTEDRVTRRLCKASGLVANTTLKCYFKTSVKDFINHGPLKVEMLSDVPPIVRIHDIITEKESKLLRMHASQNLTRSTVNVGGNSRQSEARIAKTSWVSALSNEVFQRVDERLAAVIGLSLHSSEHFQVVNYGLGGYFAPHMDAAKATVAYREFKKNGEPSSHEDYELYISDRLATILLYLNQVEAGGNTAFPLLKLTVTPIERSAVYWFNLHSSGDPDYLVFHTGCPILVGSKWIATKWPKENDNCFLRPCPTRMDEISTSEFQ